MFRGKDFDSLGCTRAAHHRHGSPKSAQLIQSGPQTV